MLQSNPFGYAILVYALVATPIISGMGDFVGVLFLFAPFLLLFFPVVMLSYLIGAIGLIKSRRWGSLVVLVSALVEFFLYLASSAILAAITYDSTIIEGKLLYLTRQSLPTLILPALIAYFSFKLRRQSKS